MQAYPAYCENGRIITVGNPIIPEGRKLIITILDEPATVRDSGIQQRVKALDKFFAAIEASDEEVPEFERVKFCREVDL